MVPGGLLAHALPEHAARDDRGSAGLAAGSGRSTNVAHEVGLKKYIAHTTIICHLYDKIYSFIVDK